MPQHKYGKKKDVTFWKRASSFLHLLRIIKIARLELAAIALRRLKKKVDTHTYIFIYIITVFLTAS